MQPSQLPARLRPHLAALVPGLLIAALFLVWAAHDGGFDEDTWYWGALAALAILGATVAWLGFSQLRPPRVVRGAILLFALYVAWSYLSISWAQAPGVALDGSNRALLYLVLFTLMALLPWTVEAATAALVTFAIGVGVIGLVILFRLASTDHVASLLVGGRLASPTGYDNGTAALFCTNVLVCVGLAARRELPAPVRGFLLALGAASLQLAIVVQSRGWLFTLPIVVAVAAFAVSDRLRVAAASALPILASVIPIHRLLAIYNSQGAGLNRAASHAGQEALLLLLGVFVLGTLLAWADQLAPGPRLSSRARRTIGTGAVAVAIAGGCAGLVAVAHGRPFHFIADQWNGFSKIQAYNPGSHFTDVGTGRYDFWRVALDGFLAHPIGGLGQDNFADYYLPRGRTPDQPEWTHSLELRLLTHTGIVGFVLFAGFIALAIVVAVRSRRRGPPFSRAIAGVALLPLVVWLIHGSLDWFWEIPALAGPALGFLGMAAALGPATEAERSKVLPRARPLPDVAKVGLTALAMITGVLVLAFPYLSVREVSLASDVSPTNPRAALDDLNRARRLDPLSSVPGRTAGALALAIGDYRVAADRFKQSISEEPGAWFSWLGAGLAASALGDRATAHRDFETARAINSRQEVVQQALDRVYSAHPLTSAQAFSMITLVE